MLGTRESPEQAESDHEMNGWSVTGGNMPIVARGGTLKVGAYGAKDPTSFPTR